MPFGHAPVSAKPYATLRVLTPILRLGMLRRVLASPSSLVGQLRSATGR